MNLRTCECGVVLDISKMEIKDKNDGEGWEELAVTCPVCESYVDTEDGE